MSGIVGWHHKLDLYAVPPIRAQQVGVRFETPKRLERVRCAFRNFLLRFSSAGLIHIAFPARDVLSTGFHRRGITYRERSLLSGESTLPSSIPNLSNLSMLAYIPAT